jgi:hypothetical protein
MYSTWFSTDQLMRMVQNIILMWRAPLLDGSSNIFFLPIIIFMTGVQMG